MAYHVIEFIEESGGGIGIARNDWLTPRKKECFWPPHKFSTQYNKSLTEGHTPDTNWKLCGVKRIFYTTDDLLKARQKLNKAENESDLQTDAEEGKRKRKPKKNLLYSPESSSEDDMPYVGVNKKKRSSEDLLNSLPTLEDEHDRPTSCCTKEPSRTSSFIVPSSSPSTSWVDKMALHSTSSPARSVEETNQPICSTPESYRSSIINESRSAANNIGEVIAKHLAKIEKRIDSICENQQIILKQLGLSAAGDSSACENNPLSNLKLPCDSHGDVENLEQWLIKNDDNKKALDKYMSLCGGKKTKVIVTRILEKLFTNKLAAEYNWTGKNAKRPLKNLKFIQIVPSAVRKNFLTTNSTDAEIFLVIQNWFRFVKDRDGGRERRRGRNEEERAGEEA